MHVDINRFARKLKTVRRKTAWRDREREGEGERGKEKEEDRREKTELKN